MSDYDRSSFAVAGGTGPPIPTEPRPIRQRDWTSTAPEFLRRPVDVEDDKPPHPTQYVKQDVCKRGHPLIGHNAYTSGRGKRECRECRNRRQREHRAERKSA